MPVTQAPSILCSSTYSWRSATVVRVQSQPFGRLLWGLSPHLLKPVLKGADAAALRPGEGLGEPPAQLGVR